jgi:hypothetical protein
MRQSVDVVALARRLGACGFRRLNSGEAERQVRRGRRVVRIVEQSQRNAPIGNDALRIGLQRLLEYFLGRLVADKATSRFLAPA